MGNRELLERAARAAGVPGVYVEVHGPELGQDAVGIGRPDILYGGPLWNSLEYDGDALQLLVKLRMKLDPSTADTWTTAAGAGVWLPGTSFEDPPDFWTAHDTDDASAAVRYTITRAAAASLED